jgi:lipopolysaccharide assembly outer membrane protein LptD (OstA)
VGLSRNIYYSPGYGYSPWDLAAGSYESVWNKAWLFGIEVPFRYGLDGKWNLSGALGKISGKFEYYSDPFFTKDFYNRSEETSLTRLLGIESAATAPAGEGEKRTMSWELNTEATFKTDRLSPYLGKLSLP